MLLLQDRCKLNNGKRKRSKKLHARGITFACSTTRCDVGRSQTPMSIVKSVGWLISMQVILAPSLHAMPLVNHICRLLFTEVRCAHDELHFNPGNESYLYHVGLCVTTRQIFEFGDPGSRACDVCEAAGAQIKYSLHRLTCKRKIKGNTQHSRSEGGKTKIWTQQFTVSRVVQTFRRMCLRRKLVDDPDYFHLLQRQDLVVKRTGKASKRVKSTFEGLSEQEATELHFACSKKMGMV